MRRKSYRVQLTAEEEKQLKDIVSKDVHPARQIRRVRILLLLNEKTDGEGRLVRVPEQTEVAGQCGCHTTLVYRAGKEYAQEGLERVINRKKRESPPVPAKVTGGIDAKIIALSCREPPEGYSRWTLRLPEERSKVELGTVLSDTTIRSVLKNTSETPSERVLVQYRRRGTRRSQPVWRTCLRYIAGLTMKNGRLSAWTGNRYGLLGESGKRSR
jgi:hypothetical protein